jgi:hypothetical protein
MVLGTEKRLQNDDTDLNVKYKATTVSQLTSYKYLGILINNTLTFKEHLNRSYKKASTGLRLLERIKDHLTPDARRKVYQMMILPLLTYSSGVDLEKTDGQVKLFSSIERRAKNIIDDGKIVNNIHNEITKQSCNYIRNCLDGTVCNNFKNYFTIMNHQINTRNNNSSLRLPRVKLSCAKKAFYFSGAKAYNNLPINIRNEKNNTTYRKLLKKHFMN